MQRLHLKYAILPISLWRGPLKKALSQEENGITDALRRA
jgi:hypothetical protein